MADIRIKDLATTASSTASDDFLAVDGTTNGTRKLNAYSPTFGGNLTVSGNASTFGGTTAPSVPVAVITQAPGGNLFPGLGITTAGGSSTKYWNLFSANVYTDSDLFFVPNSTALASAVARISNSGAMTLNGNLTVSGGTVTSGTGTLTLNSSANTVVLQSAGTTALTLDSSQNATFAGNTTAKGTIHYFGADNSQRIELTSNNGSSQGLIEFYNRGTSAYFAARYLASSHTFEQGPIAINNTVQTAASVVSTHKVTISIGGVTYYLLATNV